MLCKHLVRIEKDLYRHSTRLCFSMNYPTSPPPRLTHSPDCRCFSVSVTSRSPNANRNSRFELCCPNYTSRTTRGARDFPQPRNYSWPDKEYVSTHYVWNPLVHKQYSLQEVQPTDNHVSPVPKSQKRSGDPIATMAALPSPTVFLINSFITQHFWGWFDNLKWFFFS